MGLEQTIKQTDKKTHIEDRVSIEHTMIIQWNSIGLNEVYRSSAGNADCLIGQDQQDWEQHL